MITLGNAYQDILHRAGEGYSNYLDRARELFWRAVGSIIQSGEYQPHEVINISKSEIIEYAVSAFPLAIYEYQEEVVFTVDYNLQSETLSTSKVTPLEMEEIARHRIEMSKLSGIDIILWAQHPSDIRIAYDSGNETIANGNLIVEARRISISPAYITNGKDNENIDETISITLAARAIELATQMIIQEMRG